MARHRERRVMGARTGCVQVAHYSKRIKCQKQFVFITKCNWGVMHRMVLARVACAREFDESRRATLFPRMSICENARFRSFGQLDRVGMDSSEETGLEDARDKANNGEASRHEGVPYYSQWGSPEWVAAIVENGADPCDDPGWRRSGFAQADDYRFWAKRLCGLTCLESALDYWEIEHAPRAGLLQAALRHGVYRVREDGGVDGLIYRPFAEWVEADFGVGVEVMTDESLEATAARLNAETLAIVSVSPEIRYPDRPNARTGGHLILLHGRGEGGVWFHNPSGVAPYQADAWLPYATVARFHARRGMALTKPK